MSKYYDKQKVISKKGKYYLTTDVTTEQESIDLSRFYPENQKGVTLIANSSYSEGNNTIISSYFNDTITAKNSKYELWLYGNNKKVTTGNFENTFHIESNGKNIINSGNQKDVFNIKNGNNTIVDKGGDNEFRIYRANIGAKHTKNNIKTGNGNDNFTVISGDNTIKTTGGNNTFNIQGYDTYKITSGAGIDTFNISSYADMTINSGAGDDVFKIDGFGNKTIKTGDGNDNLKIYESGDMLKNNFNKIDTGNGNDTITTDIEADYIPVTINDIATGKGEDTVTIKACLVNYINTGKDTDTVNIYGGVNNYISTGDGLDYINVYSEATTNYTTSTIRAGKGNDDIIINGGTNYIYGESGTDLIQLVNGTNTVYGGNDNIAANGGNNTINTNTDKVKLYSGENIVNTLKGKSTIDIEGGEDNTIYLKKGNSTVNLKGGTAAAQIIISGGKNTVNITNASSSGALITSSAKTNQTVNIDGCSNASFRYEVKNGACNILDDSSSNEIYGGDNAETFNIKGGSSNTINGKAGNDIFNIYGGNINKFYGGDGNDIYNLNMKSGMAIIEDSAGKNTVNVAKGFKGVASIGISDTAELNLKFDKSYKLTSSANIKNDIITTSDSNITLYRNFSKTGDFVEGWGIQLITNVKDEISDKIIDDRFIDIGYDESAPTNINIGGKNYTLYLNALKVDLAAWFDADTKGYTDSKSVFTGKDANDIQSLMAVYTKDTANCFIKA